MQTFIISQDFPTCAKVLDNKRLNKQKVEAYQILKVLKSWESAKGWKNHPAVLMWKNHEETLIQYALDIANECLSRGFKDTLIPKIMEFSNHFTNTTSPDWITDDFCKAHKSNLLRKNFSFYCQYNWNIPTDLPYIWPVQISK
jgi:hypothetical protein